MRVDDWEKKSLEQKNNVIKTQLIDMEWRIFKEWQRVIPEEIFETKTIKLIKRAIKEGLKIDNIIYVR